MAGGLLKRGYTFGGNAALRGRVFGSLARASFLDIETTGLQPGREGVGIWQGALGRRTATGGVSMHTNMLTNPGTAYDQASPWTRASLAETGVGQAPWSSPHTPSDFINRFNQGVRGTDLWVQNLKFESRHLGHAMSPEQFGELASSMQTYGVERDGGLIKTRRMYTTSEGVDSAVSRAWGAAPEARAGAWGDVYGAIRKELATDTPAGMTRIFDIQDVSRGMLGLAQQKGIIAKTGDVFTGTSVDVFSRLAYGIKESHLADRDIKLQNMMLESHMAIAEKLYTGQKLHKSETAYLQGISDMVPDLRKANIAKTFATAREDIDRLNSQMPGAQGYEVRGRTGTAWGCGVGRFDGSQGSKSIFVPDKGHLTSMEDVVQHLKGRELERHPDIRVDIDDMHRQFNAHMAGPGSTQDLLHSWGASKSIGDAHVATALATKPATKPGMMADAMGFGKKHWKWFAGAALGLGAIRMFGSKQDSDWEPMADAPALPLEEALAPKEFNPRGGFFQGAMDIFSGLTDGPPGMNEKYKGPVASVTVPTRFLRAEDADTVMLAMGGNTHSIRLAGIDAPETGHGGLRGNQPFGDDATDQLGALLDSNRSISVMFDPTAPTSYGRTTGVLVGKNMFGEDQNINQALVAQGGASFLPFGKASRSLIDRSAFKQAERQAFERRAGMWGSPAWVVEHTLTEKQQRRITHTTLTNPSRLEDNFRAAKVFRAMGNTIPGFDDAYNTIEGMRHGWFGQERRFNTDFGSGWQGLFQVHRQKLYDFLWGGKNSGMAFVKGIKNLQHDFKRNKGYIRRQGLNEGVGHVRNLLKEAQDEGLTKAGFISPGVVGDDLLDALHHEAVHLYIPQHVESKLKKASLSLQRGLNLPKETSWYGYPHHILEEIAAYSAEPGGMVLKRPSGAIGDLVDETHKIIDRNRRFYSGEIDINRGHGFSGFDDAYNVIEGLGHKGLAGEMRKIFTDVSGAGFGSGFQGNLNKGFMGALYGGDMEKFAAASAEDVWGRVQSYMYGISGGDIRKGDFGAAVRSRYFQGPTAPHLTSNPLHKVHWTHEASEMWHAIEAGRLSSGTSYGGHMGPGVITDELLMASKMGPDTLKKMADFRRTEAGEWAASLEKRGKVSWGGAVAENPQGYIDDLRAQVAHFEGGSPLASPAKPIHTQPINPISTPKPSPVRAAVQESSHVPAAAARSPIPVSADAAETVVRKGGSSFKGMAGAAIGMGGIALAGVGAYYLYDKFAGSKISGLPHQGVAAESRGANTDFGSPYKGPGTSNRITSEALASGLKQDVLGFQAGINRIFEIMRGGVSTAAGEQSRSSRGLVHQAQYLDFLNYNLLETSVSEDVRGFQNTLHRLHAQSAQAEAHMMRVEMGEFKSLYTDFHKSMADFHHAVGEMPIIDDLPQVDTQGNKTLMRELKKVAREEVKTARKTSQAVVKHVSPARGLRGSGNMAGLMMGLGIIGAGVVGATYIDSLMERDAPRREAKARRKRTSAGQRVRHKNAVTTVKKNFDRKSRVGHHRMDTQRGVF